ncbi:Trk family potassium uptake protein [candidate division KSB1 bacterium]|nr:MAG: Trk family potassium uptake protein [candidate division KSB1 bacterium]
MLKPTTILIFSFLILISVGSILLSFPFASQTEPLSYVDALFTATSATCVTGLTVVDTGSKLSTVGQLIVLTLFQLGGLGIMTFSTFFISLLGGRVGFRERDIVSSTLQSSSLQDIKTLLKSVIVVTAVLELVGAVILTFRFSSKLPITVAIYHGIFHAVSAFCNAGFSLYTDSFISYQNDAVVNLTLIGLIIVGGIGFIVLLDLKTWSCQRRQKERYRISFHTKVVLSITAILIMSGFLLFFMFEFNNSLQGLPSSTKVWVSLFQSITPRTAGFNTIPMEKLTASTLLVLVILMFIGASPGSCGGGIKTSTFAVLMGLMSSTFHGREDVELFHRTVPRKVVTRAVPIAFLALIVIITMTLILLTAESKYLTTSASHNSFLKILFEVVSAFGTVGLSLGLTSSLTTIGKIALIVTMFVGRLGPLTIVMAIAERQKEVKFQYPTEEIMVG